MITGLTVGSIHLLPIFAVSSITGAECTAQG
jgi:hypothetical protein